MNTRLRRLRLVVTLWFVWLRREIGAPEILTALGVALVGRGLWLISPSVGLITSGVIVLWCGLPSRPPFIEPPSTVKKETR